MAAAEYGSVGSLASETWETAIEAIATRGMVFRREPYHIVLYLLFGALLLGILGPALTEDTPHLPGVIFALLAGIGLVAAVRYVDVRTARELVLGDEGLENRQRDRRPVRIHWRSLARLDAPPALSSSVSSGSGERIWLLGEADGAQFLRECVTWCFENRSAISSNGGSLIRTLEGMMSREGISFRFNWWEQLTNTVLFAGLLLGLTAMIIANGVDFSRDSTLALVGVALIWCLFAALFVSSLHNWTDASARIVVSARGVEKMRPGRPAIALTWDDICAPQALKFRRDTGVLACDASGERSVTSSSFRQSEFLDALVDHFLIAALKRKDVLKTLKPADVWGSVDD
jgi:hypothetical protein